MSDMLKGEEEREKEGERSKGRQQTWEWAEMKYKDSGQNSIYKTFHSLPWLFGMPNLEISRLRGTHLRACSAYFPWLTLYLMWPDGLKCAHLVRLNQMQIVLAKVIYAKPWGVLSGKVQSVMWHHVCNPIKTLARRGVTFKPSVNIVQLSYSSESDPIRGDQHPRNIISK